MENRLQGILQDFQPVVDDVPRHEFEQRIRACLRATPTFKNWIVGGGQGVARNDRSLTTRSWLSTRHDFFVDSGGGL